MSSMLPGPSAAPGAAASPEPPARPAQADVDPLDELAARPLAEHADVFGRLHAELQAALADIDHG